MKELEHLINDFQELARVGAWELDVSTMTVIWTRGTYKIHEIPVGSTVKVEDAINFYAPHEREKISKLVQECIENGVSYDDEFQFITATGKHLWVRAKGKPKKDKTGKIIKIFGTFQDVTDEKSNEKKLEILFDQSKDAMMTLISPDWKFSSCNKATLELFNVKTKEEFTKLGPWGISPEYQPDGKLSSEKAEVEIKKAIINGSNFFEWTHSTIEGKEIPCTVLLSRIDENDRIYLHAVARDISEQKKLEQELKDTNEYLDLAIEGAGLGIWDWNLTDDTVTYDNKWAQMLGYDATDLATNISTWRNLVHPEDIGECLKQIQAYQKGKTEHYECTHRLKHKDGHWVYILGKGRFSEWDKNGKPTRFTGTNLDVTSSKEQESRKLEEFNEILSSTPSCLKIVSKEGLLLDMNAQGLSLIEADDLSSVFKANVYNIVCDEYRDAFIKFNEKICSGEEGSLIFKIKGLKGTVRWMETYAAPYKLINGEIAHIAITNDVTDKINSENELKEQKAMAQHQAKLASIGELAAGIGHEINNPLAAVKGYVSVMEKKLKKGIELSNEDLYSYFDKMNIAINRITNIIQGLRTFSRSDSDILTTFSPVEAIEESINMIGEIYQSENINLQFRTEIDKQWLVTGSRGNFLQIIMNLISNAKDAINDNDKKEIQIIVFEKNDNIEVKVSDNGSGIPKELQNKIFEPFFTTKDVNKGTGIGLAMVYNFVTELGGTIKVISDEDKGTTFHLIIPAIKSIQPLTHSSLDSSIMNFDGQDQSVLIVDDEDSVRQLLKELLNEYNLNIFTAKNGEEALKLIQSGKTKIDYVISDVKMPIIGGAELIKSIRQSPEIEQPFFILITGGIKLNFEDQSNEINKLIDGYLYKPFDEEQLVKLLKSLREKKNVA